MAPLEEVQGVVHLASQRRADSLTLHKVSLREKGREKMLKPSNDGEVSVALIPKLSSDRVLKN